MNINTVGILIPFIMNFILLFKRKKKWAQSGYRWTLVLAMFFASLILFLSRNSIKLEIPNNVIWGFMTPLIFSLIDRGLTKLSYAIHSRDLYLWLRGSVDIDDSRFSGGKHVRASDRVFSMLMLLSVM